MSIEIKTPMLPESITDATVAVCHKQQGQFCQEGDVIVELETDKVMLEVTATHAGTITQLLVKEGDILSADTVIAVLTEGENKDIDMEPVPELQVNIQKPAVTEPVEPKQKEQHRVQQPMSPSQRRDAYSKPSPAKSIPVSATVQKTEGKVVEGDFDRQPMSRLRAKIATRLVEATSETAMLTTFNEVRMDSIIQLRKTHQEAFVAKYGVKLGFMSFFVHAVCKALVEFPAVNASVDGHDILYHRGQHVGIAVSTDRGLVVPVLKNAQDMSYSEIEMQIKQLAEVARAGKISFEQLQGGTFTITNGGVFGSMLSTPIINMPQSAILGMHAITKRPIVIDDEVSIASMMYLALSYDHRLIDGQQSVQFLVRVKNILENPDLVLLDL
jgi:2-oxoglutarate dehydrogenase E2 component (dihydrolipoamide succinyltransferase)